MSSRSKRLTSQVVAVLAPFIACASLLGEDSGAPATAHLADLSLEQLMNESVTSVSKKPTKLDESPAAIGVITSEDVRRLGITTIPEALRLMPGLDVARINGNEWAIGARGFNAQFANKLLVMVDGRTVYTPASGGVFWNVQDVVLEDLDRIEVIRGPGATMWGANAVDGVINIITKSAKETQGTLVTTSMGTEDRPSATVRYGDRIGTNLYFRVYAKYFDRDGLVSTAGHEGADDWNAERGGFRVDWEPSVQNTLTLQGDYYSSRAGKTVELTSLTPPFGQAADVVAANKGGNVIGRWTHAVSDTSQFTVQSYFDRVQQDDGFGREYHNTYDFDFQHRFAIGSRNDVIWGTGYRYTDIENTPSFNITWNPEIRQLQLLNVFAQDEITLVPDRLRLTFGSKVEHNNLTGIEIQPSARLLWTPSESQSVWGSVSRATRMPSLVERGVRLNPAAFLPAPGHPPVLVSLFGNPEADEEKLVAYELGYRIEPTKRLSFDITGFFDTYEDLLIASANPVEFEVSPLPAHTLISTTFRNGTHGETYGTELSAKWAPTDYWRLAGSYTWLHMHLLPDSTVERASPQQQFQLRSYLDLPGNLEFNSALFYVDQVLPESFPVALPVSSYFRLDLGVIWHPTKALEIGVWGQNLLESSHAEYNSVQSRIQAEIPRSVLGKITWRF